MKAIAILDNDGNRLITKVRIEYIVKCSLKPLYFTLILLNILLHGYIFELFIFSNYGKVAKFWICGTGKGRALFMCLETIMNHNGFMQLYSLLVFEISIIYHYFHKIHPLDVHNFLLHMFWLLTMIRTCPETRAVLVTKGLHCLFCLLQWCLHASEKSPHTFSLQTYSYFSIMMNSFQQPRNRSSLRRIYLEKRIRQTVRTMIRNVHLL